ncbi:hypothetical protein AVEN_235789-1 [Araneus ventricosus]|uniref:Uncharacterized protein n=1 Tax=Araneus ventricosus TaxID=182803 RepID=A0A4Y2VPM3_ARAVE|nr:hypothetical protein AVEN_235789-1 [Araneus ventricosus]
MGRGGLCCTSPTGGHLASTDLTRTRPANTAVLWWNLEPSCPRSRPYHQTTAALQNVIRSAMLVQKLNFIYLTCYRFHIYKEKQKAIYFSGDLIRNTDR